MQTTREARIIQFFAIEFRTVAKGDWLQPQQTPKPIPEKDRNNWSLASGDSFGFRVGTWQRGGTFKPLWPAVNEDMSDVSRATSFEDGWFKHEHALKVLRHIEARDDQGDYDYTDSYSKKTQSVRHQFRICRRHIMNFIEELGPDSMRAKPLGSTIGPCTIVTGPYPEDEFRIEYPSARPEPAGSQATG